MVEDFIGAYGGRMFVAILGVGLGFLLLIGILWMIRGRGGPSPFVRGGKNRQPRLQVLDAAAVDTRRRLVLVRRDDVEHLIMIGGPTDIVVESRIMPAPSRDQVPSPDAFTRQDNALARPQGPEAQARPQQIPQPPRSVQSRVLPAAPEASAEPTAQAVNAPAAAIARTPPSPSPRPVAAPHVAPEAPPVPPATPRPVAVAMPPNPAAAPRLEPQPRVAAAPDMRPQTPKPQPVAAPATAEFGAAAAYVPKSVEPVLIVPPSAVVLPQAIQAAADRPKQLGTDFDKILEQEMEANLAAHEAPQALTPSVNPASNAVPSMEKEKPTPQASLEAEVEAVFGEMSATRDR